MSGASDQLPVPHPVVKDRDGQDWYRWKETCVKPWVADQYARNKHLTDAELAAEVWRSAAVHYARVPGPDAVEEGRLNGIFERFAITPHLSEEVA